MAPHGVTGLVSGVKDAIRRLDHALGRRTSGVRVLVDVRTPMNLSVLRPVWRRLRDDPRVRLSFAAEDREAVLQALESDGLRDALVDRDAARFARWDLAITADAWNHTPLGRCRRTIQFFHGVAGKYDLDNPGTLGAAGLDLVDRVAFINEDRMRRYVQSGAIRHEQAVLVGYPKGDDLVNGAWPAAGIRQSLGLEPSRRTVLYAPTFSTASSLHLAGPRIIEALLQTDANVIVKLHDRSMRIHPKHTGGIDWPVRLAAFESNPRFVLARGPDAGPLLSAADVLVTDHSTVGFEFALLDRPIVVYDAPELKAAARIDAERWELLRSMAHVVNEPDTLRHAVMAAMVHPSRRREERRQARSLFAFPGRATERAMAAVYELLELEPMSRRETGRDPERLGLARA